MADIFRKKSLEKLSSPEQLDKMIVINSPMTWFALAGGIFILVVALLWGIFARVPITEQGSGILLRQGEVTSVYAGTQGVVVKSHINGGDKVKEGDVLYEVTSEEIKVQAEELSKRIDKVEAVTFTSSNDATTSDTQPLINIKAEAGKLPLEKSSYSTQRAKLQESYNKKQSETGRLKAASETAKKQYYNAIETDPTSANTAELQNEYSLALSRYNTASAELRSIKAELDTADVQVSVSGKSESVYRTSLQEQFEAAKGAVLDELNRQLGSYNELMDGMEIKATTDGIVYSTFVTNGSMVAIDTEVARISESKEGSKLIAVYFMPLNEGKMVKEGMEVNIYPGTVSKEEYGHMKGKVIEVTDFVTSYADLYTRVGESTLADTFAAGGAVVEVICEIDADSGTKSGFAWSSRKGETLELTEGTLLGGAVVTEEVRPISMLIPKLKEMFSSDKMKKAQEEAAATETKEGN